MSEINRGTVTIASDEAENLKMRTVQVEVYKDDPIDDVEHFETYGLTSRPAVGAEVLVATLGDTSDHSVILAVADRRYRVTGLKTGEVCLHDDLGQKVYLTRDGIVIETTKTVKVKCDDVQLGNSADASLAKWTPNKSFQTQLLEALGDATAGGYPLTFTTAKPLPTVASDAVGGTTKVTAK